MDTDNFEKSNFQTYSKFAGWRLCTQKGWSIEEVTNFLGNPLVLGKLLNNCTNEVNASRKEELNADLMLEAKRYGFSDKPNCLWQQQRRRAWGPGVREKMKGAPCYGENKLTPWRNICKTNYLYLTYHGSTHDVDYARLAKEACTVVLGSRLTVLDPHIEFDWCSVNAVTRCPNLDTETIMINYNPETVSTDYDTLTNFNELSLGVFFGHL